MAKKNQIAIPDAVRAGVLAVKPDATDRFIEKCWRAGIRENNVETVVSLCQFYKRSISAVAKHMNQGLSLERVGQCFDLQTKIEMTVPMANKYISALNFHAEDPAVVLEELIDPLGNENDTMAPNRLYHQIEKRFGGNILLAYHMSLNNHERYQLILDGRLDLLDCPLSDIANDDEEGSEQDEDNDE